MIKRIASVTLALGVAGLQSGTIGAATQIIHLDAIVTDQSDRPIRDLRASDFVLSDGGEPRAIDGVRLQSGGSRLIAIFLDEYHVAAGESTQRARDALFHFVDTQLRADDVIAVMKPLDPLNAIELTQNRSAVREAISAFGGRKGDYAPRSALEESLISRAPQQADAARAQVVTSALQALTGRLAEAREGRKALVLISEGFAPILPRGSDRLMGNARAIVYAANRSGVSIYSIDPRPPAAVSGSGAGAGDADRDTSTLRTLAQQTGGQASIGHADLARGLTQVVEDLDGYYVLTYASGEADGKFHPVEMRVKRAGAQIRARSGYWSASAVEPRSTSATPRPGTTLTRPPHSSPYIRPWVGMSRDAAGTTSVTVTWEPAAAPPRNQRVTTVALKATTNDGRVLFEDRIDASEIDDRGAITKSQGHATFNAPPGYIALEMAVQGTNGTSLDIDYRAMRVPDLRVTSPTFATPRVVRTRGARAFSAASVDPDALPTASREFSRTERLLLRIPVYDATDRTPQVIATLLNRRGVAIRQLDELTAALSPGIVQFDLPLSSLAPDEYGVELTVAGPGSIAARELVIFRVTN